jgi:hypothetical protein
VEVRSEAEILATLDANGELDHLPFMPEMRRFIGKRHQVRARAERTFVETHGLRSLLDTVHLDGLYCDGEAHDGCGRACLLFWKEAWLKPVAGPHETAAPAPPGGTFPCTVKECEGGGYVCQATRLHLASTPLRSRELDRHVSAVWNEGLPPGDLGRGFMVLVHDLVQRRVLGGPRWAVVPGTCAAKTPTASLGLEAGERVRVKSAPEILSTLDENGSNRGLEFSREMLRFCGKEFTVLKRCEQIIRDDPPRMIKMRNTVILEGLSYAALSCLAVPRGEYFFWRECWLERVGRSSAGLPSDGDDR